MARPFLRRGRRRAFVLRMPTRAPTACSYAGCRERTHERFCPRHKREEQRRYDKERGSGSARGYGARWRKARKRFLIEHPFCATCDSFANVADHVVPHKGDKKLFWDRNNWQALCKQCHDRKTAVQDGRWG